MRHGDVIWLRPPLRLALRLAFLLLRAYWRLRRPRSNGTLVAVWHAGEILLVRNSYRRPYNLPGGCPRRDEAPLDAARRELAEEIGLSLPPERLRALGIYRSEFENRRDTVHLFEAVLDECPPLRPDGVEISWAGFVSPAEARERPLVPTLRRYLAQSVPPGAAAGDAEPRAAAVTARAAGATPRATPPAGNRRTGRRRDTRQK